MKDQLSPRDLESLSAYSDGQLKPDEIGKIEERLQADSDSRTKLAELKWTRRILRSLPVLRAPRSFMLSPELVQETRSINVRLFPVFRMMSAAATILFVIMAIGDYFNVTKYLNGAGTDYVKPQAASEIEEETIPSIAAAEAPQIEVMEMESEQEEVGSFQTEIAKSIPM